MMQKLIFTLVMISSICLNAQVVEDISISNSKKTKRSYILSEIGQIQGKAFSDSLKQHIIQAAKNIHGISSAEARFDNGEISLTIEEERTFLPIVNFGGIKENIWFQLGVSDINFTGRGHQLQAFYQYSDRRNTFSLFYKIPTFKKRKWGASFSILNWASLEPLYFPQQSVNYKYDNRAIGVSLIRNVSNMFSIELGSTIFQEIYEKQNQLDITLPGPDNIDFLKYLNKINLQFNRLNYDAFYLTRSISTATWQYVYNFDNPQDFHSLILMHKHYWKFGNRGNLAGRFRFAISSNNDSPFAPFVVDSNVNIRGVGNRIDRGTAQLIINLEYRHTMINRNKWAAQLIGFTDNGSWRSPGGSLDQLVDSNTFRQFIGGGFRVIFKPIYNAILRIDYGIDIYNKDQKGFVIGIGQYY